MPTISFSEGRLIEITEGALRVPEAAPKVRKVPGPRKAKQIRKGGRDKSITLRGFKYKCDPRKNPPRLGVTPPPNPSRLIPGYEEWRALRHRQINSLTAKGRPVGAVAGLTVQQAEARWVLARRQAKRDMEVITQKISLDDSAQEALLATLTIMRGPQNLDQKLKAARQVLDFTMAKPVARQDVTINMAEEWLSKLGEDEPGSGD